jgi:hypothetical protein
MKQTQIYSSVVKNKLFNYEYNVLNELKDVYLVIHYFGYFTQSQALCQHSITAMKYNIEFCASTLKHKLYFV